MNILEEMGRWEARKAMKNDISTSQLRETGGVLNPKQTRPEDDEAFKKFMGENPSLSEEEAKKKFRKV